jgi:uncharacterized protein (TIGR02266 family)
VLIYVKFLSTFSDEAMDRDNQPASAAIQKNQRRNLRVPLIVEKIPCDDGRKTFFGYARNISRGGLFIATVSPREPGDQFDLQVTLPASAGFTLRCRCEVVWKRRFEQGQKHEPGMGLRFLDLPVESADALALWLRQLAGSGVP